VGIGARRSLGRRQLVSAGRCAFLRCVALKSTIESFITAMFALTCAALALSCSPHWILLQFGFLNCFCMLTPDSPPPLIFTCSCTPVPGGGSMAHGQMGQLWTRGASQPSACGGSNGGCGRSGHASCASSRLQVTGKPPQKYTYQYCTNTSVVETSSFWFYSLY